MGLIIYRMQVVVDGASYRRTNALNLAELLDAGILYCFCAAKVTQELASTLGPNTRYILKQ